MRDWKRFEKDGLLKQERGEPLDENEENPEARQAYDRLRQAILKTAPDDADDETWKQRVFRQIDREERRRRLWRVAAPLAAAAALVFVLFVMPRIGESPPTASTEPVLSVTVRDGAGEMRGGDTAQPGSQLRLEAVIGRRTHAELRVYLYNNLLLRCADEPPCELAQGVLTASLTLDQIGLYHALLITSEEAIPGPFGTLDEDISAILDAGARVATADPIEVR